MFIKTLADGTNASLADCSPGADHGRAGASSVAVLWRADLRTCRDAVMPTLWQRRRGEYSSPSTAPCPFLMFEVPVAGYPAQRTAAHVPNAARLVTLRDPHARHSSRYGAKPPWAPGHVPACSIFLPLWSRRLTAALPREYHRRDCLGSPRSSTSSEDAFARSLVSALGLAPCLVIIVVP